MLGTGTPLRQFIFSKVCVTIAARNGHSASLASTLITLAHNLCYGANFTVGLVHVYPQTLPIEYKNGGLEMRVMCDMLGIGLHG